MRSIPIRGREDLKEQDGGDNPKSREYTTLTAAGKSDDPKRRSGLKSAMSGQSASSFASLSQSSLEAESLNIGPDDSASNVTAPISLSSAAESTALNQGRKKTEGAAATTALGTLAFRFDTRAYFEKKRGGGGGR